MKSSPLFAIAAGIVMSATSSRSAILLSQNFDTDPVNYTNSPFAVDTTDPTQYWAPTNFPGIAPNAGITGNTTTYLAGQNMDIDGDNASLPYTTASPAFMEFVVPAAGLPILTLSIDLAGLPSAEAANYIRAFVDADGDGAFESPLFNFRGLVDNSAYTDDVLGALSGAFATFPNIPVPPVTAPDGMLRLRLEVFNDTNSQNEAAGVDNIVINGEVPEPGSAMLAILGGLGVFRRRRR